MPFEARIVVGLLLAVGAVYALTPVAIQAAARFNFYDKPAGYKGHARPTPYLGGTAVVVGFAVALLLAAAGDTGNTLTLLGGMSILLVVGTIDDRINVSPGVRVLVEVAIAVGVWAAGLGWDLGGGAGLDLALTIAWIVAVVNAFNLFDNMDGAAGTMAAVVAAIVAVLGITHDDHWLAITGAVLCGTCLGFLPHNLASPARIFLGDGGSMPLGFAVATLVMVGSSEAAPAGMALLLGLLLVGVPATDTFMVIVSRRRRGVGVLTGGRDHLTHRTRQWLRTARAVAIGLGAIQALVSVIAVFAIRGGSASFLVILVVYLVAAATVIAFLETRYEESVEASAGAATGAGFAVPGGPGLLACTVFGIAIGLTPFVSGLYSEGKWIPVGLALLIATTVGAIARPVAVSRPQALLVGILVGLGMLGLASATWAPSIAQATSDGNRWLVLAALAASAIVLARSERSAQWLATGLAAGIAVVAAYVVIVMLGTDPAQLLLGGRLHEPLGYVNAQATTFLMGFWLWFAAVEHRSRLVASVGLGVATTMAGMVMLTQSRGAAIAMTASIVLVAALPGRRMRRAFAMLCVALGVVAASGQLLDVYSGQGLAADCREAALALIGASLGVAALWWVAGLLLERLKNTRPATAALVPRAGAIALAVLALAGMGTALAERNDVGNYVDTQWTAFVELETAARGSQAVGTARLASGAGYRYDYWRVAWDAFGDRPLQGYGAGNYDRPYFRARATAEAVRQPHSLLLQELSELGILGGLLVIGLASSFVWGLVRLWRFLAAGGTSPAGVAAAGVLVAWLVHTNVDWIHLVPGVTGIALAMAALLLRTRGAPGDVAAARTEAPRWRLRSVTTVAAVAATIVLVVAAASLSRSGLATFFRDRAQNALADRPHDAITEADRSLRLDAENPRTYYVKAAAQSRFNDAEGAQRTLEEALRKEPDNFVSWTLLGDLAVRVRNFSAAKRYYSQALRYNPGDPTLQALAADPTEAASE